MGYIFYGIVVHTFFRYFNAAHPFAHAEERFSIRVGGTYSVYNHLIVVETDYFGLFRYERPVSVCFLGHFASEADFYFLGIRSVDPKVHPPVFAYARIIGSVNVVLVGNGSRGKTLLLGIHCQWQYQ